MDKRILGFVVLALGIMIVWSQVVAPALWPKKPEPAPTSRPATESRSTTVPAAQPLVPAASRAVIAESERKTLVLENDNVRLTLSNVGAVVTGVELKEFHPHAGSTEPMPLLKHYRDAARALELRSLADPTSQFESRAWAVAEDRANRRVIFTLSQPDRWEVTKTITLAKNASVANVDFGFTWIGPGERIVDQRFRLVVAGGISIDGDFHESGDLTGASSGIYATDAEGKRTFTRILPADAAKSSSKNQEGFGVIKSPFNATGKFAADLNPYFGVYAGFDSFPERMESAVAGLFDPDAHGRAVGVAIRSRAEAEFPVAGTRGVPTVHSMFLYFGPNDPALMAPRLGDRAETWAPIFTEVHDSDLGFFGLVARVIIAILRFFHMITSSWGWSIVLLTITVRVVLFPINRRSQMAMIRHAEVMGRIKPDIDRLREKHKDDPRALMAEQGKLMKANGVSMMPLGGCLPLFLQLPVFYGLFSGLRSSLELRQASFLWVQDLSQPDHLVRFSQPVSNPLVSLGSCCLPPGSSETISGFHLLPILMMLAWFANSWLQPRPATTTPEAESQRKMMMFMPLLFGFMMYGYAAGLSLYWLVSSLMGIVESKVIKRSMPQNPATATVTVMPPSSKRS